MISIFIVFFKHPLARLLQDTLLYKEARTTSSAVIGDINL